MDYDDGQQIYSLIVRESELWCDNLYKLRQAGSTHHVAVFHPLYETNSCRIFPRLILHGLWVSQQGRSPICDLYWKRWVRETPQTISIVAQEFQQKSDEWEQRAQRELVHELKYELRIYRADDNLFQVYPAKLNFSCRSPPWHRRRVSVFRDGSSNLKIQWLQTLPNRVGFAQHNSIRGQDKWLRMQPKCSDCGCRWNLKKWALGADQITSSVHYCQYGLWS